MTREKSRTGSAHTPGPWVAERFGAVRTLSKTHERHLARGSVTPQVAAALGDESIDDEERMANARLIAAAPDLLGVAMRVGCQDRGSCGPDEPDGLCFVCAAVAKARGGK